MEGKRIQWREKGFSGEKKRFREGKMISAEERYGYEVGKKDLEKELDLEEEKKDIKKKK